MVINMSKIQYKQFLTKVEEIAAEEPGYQRGHYGQDHLCDCIGLIIGAIRRAGGEWRGTHGSNYAARAEVDKIKPIVGTGDLRPGEVVFKAYDPGQGGYKLPGKYEKGGEYYNGDLRDYYHVGVVMSVYPLRIRHMTTPRQKTDTSIGKWSYHGCLKKISESEEEGKPLGKVIISGGNPDKEINIRASASIKGVDLGDIPQGAEAELIEGGGYWNRIRWNGITGYVKSEFVHPVEEAAAAGETVTVNRAELEKAYDILGGLLGLRG
jgi:hypothetical protein